MIYRPLLLIKITPTNHAGATLFKIMHTGTVYVPEVLDQIIDEDGTEIMGLPLSALDISGLAGDVDES